VESQVRIPGLCVDIEDIFLGDADNEAATDL